MATLFSATRLRQHPPLLGLFASVLLSVCNGCDNEPNIGVPYAENENTISVSAAQVEDPTSGTPTIAGTLFAPATVG